MGRLIVTVTAGAVILVSLRGQAQSQDELVQRTKTGLEYFRTQLVPRVPINEGLKIDAVNVVIDPNVANFSTPFAATSSMGRQVRFPLGYLARLHGCIEAMTMDSLFKSNQHTSDLKNAYDIHITGAIAFFGQELLPLATFARLSDAEKQQWESAAVQAKIGAVFDHALAFVFAHELGHHALDAFYQFGAPSLQTQAIERRADDWAMQALTVMGIAPVAGATAAIACLDTDAWYTYVPTEQASHLGRADRLLQSFAAMRSKWQPLYSKAPYNSLPLNHYRRMEEGLDAILKKEAYAVHAETAAALEAQATSAATDIPTTKARLNALLKLSRLYEYGWGVPRDLAKRHEVLVRAANEGDFAAQYSVAYDQDTGKGTPLNRAEAFVTYTWLANAGHKAAQVSLTDLPKRATTQQICEGRCRVASGGDSFKRCIDRRQAACVRSCTNDHRWEYDICQHRMCSTMTNYQYWYSRCVPVSPDTATCHEQCAAQSTLVTAPEVNKGAP